MNGCVWCIRPICTLLCHAGNGSACCMRLNCTVLFRHKPWSSQAFRQQTRPHSQTAVLPQHLHAVSAVTASQALHSPSTPPTRADLSQARTDGLTESSITDEVQPALRPVNGTATWQRVPFSDADSADMECVVCWAEDACICFQPCGHLVTCSGCAQPILEQGLPCPMCRALIEGGIAPVQ